MRLSADRKGLSDELRRTATGDYRDRQQVTCVYQGRYRECCPHAIGTKKGRAHVLMFQFAGDSSKGLPPGGEWRCMNIDDLDLVTVQEGDWHTDDRHSRPQTCIDMIDIDVTMV